MSLAMAYRGLLRLYPRDYHDSFAKEMLNVFESATEEHCQTRFVLAEFAGLLVGVTKEWIAKLTTDRAVRGRCLPDLRMMRPAGVSKEAWFSAPALEARQEAKG
jgi:hypothetical protein